MRSFSTHLMAFKVYNAALKAIVDGTIDLNGSDIRAILCMTNATADTGTLLAEWLSNTQ